MTTQKKNIDCRKLIRNQIIIGKEKEAPDYRKKENCHFFNTAD
jgi:hypothetical protein